MIALDAFGIVADQKFIPYRPKLNAITGDLRATIFLQQVMWRWFQNNREPFYKFSAPCAHPLHREGDSWQEELGFSRRDFDNARDAVATKITGGISKKAVMRLAQVQTMVVYWTDNERLTWYEVNEDAVMDQFTKVYPGRDVQNVQRLLMHGLNSSRKMPNRALHDSEITPEMTPEISVAYATEAGAKQDLSGNVATQENDRPMNDTLSVGKERSPNHVAGTAPGSPDTCSAPPAAAPPELAPSASPAGPGAARRSHLTDDTNVTGEAVAGLPGASSELSPQPSLLPEGGNVATPPAPRRKSLATQRIEAYERAVTAAGHLTGKRNIKDVLGKLDALGVAPEDIEAMIAWRLAEYPSDRACFYHIERVPDDLRSYRAWRQRLPAARPILNTDLMTEITDDDEALFGGK